MRHLRLLAAVAAVLALGCGRPLLSAQADIERISVTTPAVSFPDLRALGPVAAHLDPTLLSTTIVLSYDMGEVPVEEKGVTTELQLTGFTLHLRSAGAYPPDNLRAMSLVLVDPSTAATTVVASYVKGAAPTPQDVAFSVSATDLMPFVAQKKLEARLRFAFDATDLPNAFDAATELSFSARVTVDYTRL